MKTKHKTELNDFEQSICHAMLTNCNTNIEIAQRLGVSRQVIGRALSNICAKQGLADKVALLRWLYQQQDLEKLP